MLPSEAKLIHQYFELLENLSKPQIIRSKNILGDIGEWICEHKYHLVRESNNRHPGYDGKIGADLVQVKVNNSQIAKNLNVGDPDKYDEIIVLLGPSSYLRVLTDDAAKAATFHVYRFPSKYVKDHMKQKVGYSLARKVLQNVAPDFVNIEHQPLKYKASPNSR